MSAWHGDAVKRDEMIARFQSAVAVGQFDPDEYAPANRDRYHGATYCLTGQQDSAQLAEQTGFPPAIAALLPTVTQNAATGQAADIVLAWLSAPAPGANLDGVPGQLLVEVLEDPDFATALRRSDEAAALLSQLIALHRADVDGTPASRAQWRAFRKEAVAMVEASPPNEREAVRVLETFAWPIGTAPELLRALLSADVEARQAQAAIARGIAPPTPADDELVDRILNEQLAAGLEQDAAFTELDRILAEEHPDFVARSKILSELIEEAMPVAASVMSERVVRHLSDARA